MAETAKIFRSNGAGDGPAPKRASAAERGYNHRWRKAALAFLREHPMCIDCAAEGRDEFATEVDHEIPHRGDQEIFWRQDGWRARCKACHSRKTARGG